MVFRFESVVASMLALCFPVAAYATVIFDNFVPGNRGITTTTAGQIGDQVTGALGTPRIVTELDLWFTNNAVGTPTANLQAFLYANDGSGGAPGTLLWQSALMSSVTISSSNFLVPFLVPSILVPNTFTFTGAITNASATVGFVPASGASTGTFVQAWVGGPGTWGALSSSFEIEGRVIATQVPEPATLALIGLGLAGLSLSRRKR